MTSTTTGRTWRRGRGLVAAAATLGLAASLLAVGAGSANAVVSPTPAWVDNPNLKASCGLDVVLVLDASRSIGTSGSTADVKAAAATLVAAFKDTNTRVGITTFASDVIASQGLVDDNADNAATLAASIAAYAPVTVEGTNWEAGVNAANNVFLGHDRTGVQKLMIVVTDGAPNKYYSSGASAVVTGTGYPNPSLDAVTPAVDRANLFKASGGRVLGIGVGTDFATTGATQRISYLERISQYASPPPSNYGTVAGQTAGPTSVTNPVTGLPYLAFDPTTTDTLIQPDYKTLGSSFRAIADNVCNSTLNLVNLATSPTAPLVYRGGGVGWQSTMALASGLAVDWVNPLPTQSNVDGGTANNSSSAAGVSVYQWYNATPNWSLLGHVTLTQKPNYSLVSVACSQKVGASSVAVPITLANGKFDVTVGGGQITCVSRSKYIGTPQAVVSLTPRVATKVYGATTTLGGKVLRPSPTVAGLYLPIKGARVAVQYLNAGTSVWKGLRVLTTTSTGAFAFAGKPAFNTTYRIYYAGATGLLGNVSNNALVRMTTKVTIKLNKNKVTRGTTVVFSGAVAPNKRGQYVWLQIYSGGHWRNVKAVKLTSTSKYAIAYKTTSRVDFKWRVLKPADVRSYTGASPAITLVVK